MNRKMSGFDWPLNIPAAPPPQRVSYKQRLGGVRQGVVGGRFLHTISSGGVLWKTRTSRVFDVRAIARRNAKDLAPSKQRLGETDSIPTRAVFNQTVIRDFCGSNIDRTQSSNTALIILERGRGREEYYGRIGPGAHVASTMLCQQLDQAALST